MTQLSHDLKLQRRKPQKKLKERTHQQQSRDIQALQ